MDVAIRIIYSATAHPSFETEDVIRESFLQELLFVLQQAVQRYLVLLTLGLQGPHMSVWQVIHIQALR